MLCGEHAFIGSCARDIYQKNEENNIRFNKLDRFSLSNEAQDFILELAHENPKYRPTAEKALENKWFKKFLQTHFISERFRNDLPMSNISVYSDTNILDNSIEKKSKIPITPSINNYHFQISGSPENTANQSEYVRKGSGSFTTKALSISNKSKFGDHCA